MNTIMNTSASTFNNLKDFLKQHTAEKSSPTHTRIGNKPLNVHGGSYVIKKEELPQFYKLYHKRVFLEKEMEYLTEKQLESGGAILIDIDLRYNYNVVERIHTKEHILDLIVLYLEVLKTMLLFTEDTAFPIYVFEKPQINRLEDGSLTKDGIHIIIGVQLDHTSQMILRESIVKKLSETWTDIPIINTWDNVFDEGITKGVVNWQMFGSRKPGYLAYELTQYFTINYDTHDSELMMVEQSTNDIISAVNLPNNLHKLSAQYDGHSHFHYTDTFQKVLDERKSVKRGIAKKTNTKIKLLSDYEDDTSAANIRIEDIINKETLQNAIDYMLNNLDIKDYPIKEAHAYTQILTNHFYEPGSHVKNTQVALALKHTDERLFLSWVMLRSKADDFDYSSITDLYARWSKYLREKSGGVTIRSIMYWAKEGNKEDYDKVRKDTIEHYVEQTLINQTDFDFATVLFHMYKERYVCSDINSKTWYVFKNHRWIQDKGQSLRMMISTEMFTIYNDKLQKLLNETLEIEPTDIRHVANKKKITKLNDVSCLLKKTSDKNNIMREAMEIFYDTDFSKKIDTNRWLMCFKNGVVDFENKIFRNGIPSDYITKCTNINYEELDETNTEKCNIAAEIKLFMEQLFPVENLLEYMWRHLASVLIGENKNQTFNIYHGRGSNGKSMLTDLMFLTLGEYAGSVPVTLITEKRPSIGGTSSEIMQLKGIRYAVMAEPRKGDRINEGIMKQLTGDSTISGRALYCDTETFTIQFHLVVCTNTLFEMNSHDDGTWRRIRICDFESKFKDPEEYFRKETYKYQFPKNKNLKDRMKYWVSIFAGMLVKIAFQTQGNVPNCDAVLECTNKYRRESDYISCFVAERISVVDPDDMRIVLKIQDVSQEFKIWFGMAAPGEKNLKLAEIKEFINNKFYEYSKEHGGWIGLQLKRSSDIDKAEDLEMLTSAKSTK